ncbi:MAG: Flagellin [bacterium ADurb.Bin243]|nr:MAG: Flagellin [bacterium ADurb.Bin243]
MYVNTNIPAFNAQRQLYANNLSLDKSLERLSSGLRINSGADDASGLAMAEKMKAQGVGLTSAIQNTQDGTSLFKIADGALDQVGRILSRLEELVVRANNRTLTDSDRITLQDEIGQLVDQISVISNNTEYNTLKLLDGNLDIKKSLTVSPGIPGSMKVLNTPGTVKTASNLILSITGRATPAVASAGAYAFGGQIGIQNSININGVDIQVAASDTLNTVLSKINQANSKTNVIAIQVPNGANWTVGLVSGVIDQDAQNVARGFNSAGSFSTPNASAVGYTLVGTAATVNIGGDTGIWSSLGFVPSGGASIPSTYSRTGTNVVGVLGGIQMQGSANTLSMEDAGSPMYGIKIGTSIFNEAYGGTVFTGQNAGTTMSAATYYITSTSDVATISTNDNKKIGLQLGANYNQSIAYSLQSVAPDVIGVGASSKLSSLKQVNVITLEDANISLKVIQKSITDVTTIRAAIGATLNRLDYTEKTLRIQRENMTFAESRIRDADMALEMTYYTRNQILSQTATAMLAQANQRPQNVLQLLK